MNWLLTVHPNKLMMTLGHLVLLSAPSTLWAENPTPVPTVTVALPTEGDALLDRVAILVDHIAILESEIQFCINLRQAQPDILESQKQALKELRKDACDQLIRFAVSCCIHQERLKEKVEQLKEQQGAVALSEELEWAERAVKNCSLSGWARSIFERYERADPALLDSSRRRWVAEAQQLRLDPELYVNLKLHEEQAAELSRALQEGSKPEVVLASQIESEVEKIIQEHLESGKLRVDAAYYPISNRTTPKDLTALFAQLKSIAQQAELDGSGSEPLAQALERARALNPTLKWPRGQSNLKTWGQVPPILKPLIKSFKPGQIAGPIHEDHRIVLYKVTEIQLESVRESVQKYRLRIFFKREAALSRDSTLRRRLKLWKKQVDAGALDFENWVQMHSDALPLTKENGLVEWKTLDEMGTDLKVQKAIEQLSVQRPISPIFKGEEGWYCIQLLDKKLEETDFREIEALKQKARKRITERSALKSAERQFEIKKEKTKIQYL